MPASSRTVASCSTSRATNTDWLSGSTTTIALSTCASWVHTSSTTRSTFKPYDPHEGIMNIKPIKTETDYRDTLKAIEGVMNAKPGTPAGDKLEVLVTLVEAYESRHYALAPPDPVEAIKF